MSSTSEPPSYSDKPYGMQQGVPVYIGNPVVGDYAISCTCPNCRQQIVTRIQKKNGVLTWLLCGGIAVFGCIFGCCLIPFCVDGCKDTEHYCPSCATIIGIHKQI